MCNAGYLLACVVLQVQVADAATCLDALFVFSLVWSVAATLDRGSAAKFDVFLRLLLAGKVTAAPDRADVDLGPGLTISYPQQLMLTALPEVRLANGGQGTMVLEVCGKQTFCCVLWTAWLPS